MGMDMCPEDQQIAEQTAKERKEHEEKLALAYEEVFKSGAGQFVLKDLSERCNFRNSCIRGENVNRPDPYAVMFQEGKRAVFNHIMFYYRHDKEQGKAR